MSGSSIQFDNFTLNCDRYELLCGDLSLRLEKLPMELLILLVERRGDLVTRQEIAQRLWGQDVFVDTEHGINTAVRKLRTALGDTPEQARFVQTVTGKGYRFIAPIRVITPSGGNGNGNSPQHVSGVPSASPARSEDREARVESAASPNPGRRRTWWVAAACLTAAVAILVVWWTSYGGALRNRLFASSRAPRIRSLAVLPLENLSGDPSQEFFADGMTDELTTMLARNTGLRVISRTSAMQCKNTRLSLPEVARQLGVDGIMEGSVERSGDRVHVNVQLVYAPTDTHLWAESYDRDLSDVGALESQLATTIAEQVGLTVSNPNPPPRPIKPEAHDAYLWGRYYWVRGVPKSGEYFQKAIDLQPDYAAAWAGLADFWVDLGPAVDPRADVAARKALDLDPQLGAAHRTMAAVEFFGHWDVAAADRESARALELDPRDSESHHMRSYVLELLGRKEEALREQKIASDLEPRLRPWAMPRLLIRLHRYDDAIQDARARIEGDFAQSDLHGYLANAYRLKGMDQQAAEEMANAFAVEGRLSEADAVRSAYSAGGMKAVLEWQLKKDEEQTAGKISPYQLALDNARLQRKEETLRYLEQAFQMHALDLIFIQVEPEFDFVHSEPRYQAILKGMKLPTTD